jgi:hypothetical protein
VRTHSILTAVASCFIAVALVSSASDQKRPVNANAYPWVTTTCLQGDKVPGVRLFLKQYKRCEGKVSQPYLEVDTAAFSPALAMP